ncbi:hypothetical protein NEOKW01_0125 [Nematocida sp. AWRm80]|nr:hypothetical protein NEOKW01_0125 [Nematocida sp. AWRm80]
MPLDQKQPDENKNKNSTDIPYQEGIEYLIRVIREHDKKEQTPSLFGEPLDSEQDKSSAINRLISLILSINAISTQEKEKPKEEIINIEQTKSSSTGIVNTIKDAVSLDIFQKDQLEFNRQLLTAIEDQLLHDTLLDYIRNNKSAREIYQMVIECFPRWQEIIAARQVDEANYITQAKLKGYRWVFRVENENICIVLSNVPKLVKLKNLCKFDSMTADESQKEELLHMEYLIDCININFNDYLRNIEETKQLVLESLEKNNYLKVKYLYAHSMAISSLKGYCDNLDLLEKKAKELNMPTNLTTPVYHPGINYKIFSNNDWLSALTMLAYVGITSTFILAYIALVGKATFIGLSYETLNPLVIISHLGIHNLVLAFLTFMCCKTITEYCLRKEFPATRMQLLQWYLPQKSQILYILMVILVGVGTGVGMFIIEHNYPPEISTQFNSWALNLIYNGIRLGAFLKFIQAFAFSREKPYTESVRKILTILLCIFLIFLAIYGLYVLFSTIHLQHIITNNRPTGISKLITSPFHN